MELWNMFIKLITLLFIIFTCILNEVNNISFIVFSFLLYINLNIAMKLVSIINIERLIIAGSIQLSIWSYFYVYPMFIILLPLSIIEMTSTFTNKKFTMIILSILPFFYVQESVQPLYFLVTLFSSVMFIAVTMYHHKILQNERKIDEMRHSLQKLSKTIIENKEYIRQAEYTFKLEERNRISQELHDKIGHSMTSALIQMQAAKQLMDIDKNKATELLQNSITISKEGIENIRLTLKNLKPSIEQVGINRLKLLLDEFSTKNEVTATLTNEGRLDIITPIQWKIMFENIKEALTNTMKYSNATSISIHIKVLNKIIKVEVKDNGIGAAKIVKGLGILGMEERTASINGKVIIDSTNGFSVTTLLPI